MRRIALLVLLAGAGFGAGAKADAPARMGSTSALALTNLRVNDPAQVPAGSNEILPAIAVSGNRILIVWRVAGTLATQRLRAAYSEDAGATYADVGWLPNLSGDWRWASDPCVQRNPTTGTYFIAAQCANPTLGRVGIAFLTAQISGGVSWGAPAILRETSGFSGVLYTDELDMNYDRTAGSLDLVLDDRVASPAIMVHSVSWDQGATWSPPTTLFNDAGGAPLGNWPRIAYAETGPIVFFQEYQQYAQALLRSTRSVNGAFEAPVAFGTMTEDLSTVPGSTTDFPFPSTIAVDRTQSSHRGQVYVAWTQRCALQSTTPSGATISESEPNNTPAQATPVPPGTGWVNGSLSPATEADCLSLALTQGQRVLVKATSLVTSGPSLTLSVEVIAPDGTHGLGLTQLPQSAMTDASELFTAPRAGTYVFKVTGFSITSYQLSFAFPTATDGFDRRDIYTSTSKDGVQWLPPMLERVSFAGFDAANLKLVVANDGRPYLFWQDWSENDPDGALMSVRAIRSSDGGLSWEPPQTISTAVSDWQSVALVGLAQKVGWRLGAATTAPVLGSSPQTAARQAPAAAMDAARNATPSGAAALTPEERVHVVWTDARNGQGDIYTMNFPVGFEVLQATTDTSAVPGQSLALAMVFQNRNTVFPNYLTPAAPTCSRHWSSTPIAF